MSTVYLRGPIMYAKVFERNRDKKGFEGQYEPYDGMYLITIGLNADDAKVVRKWNRMYAPKELGDKGFTEENGAVDDVQYFTFKRKHIHSKRNGELISEWSGPPTVVDSEGNDWSDDVDIGNGSICTVKLDVTKPKGNPITYVRLEKIRVDDHVPYEGGSDFEEEEVDKPKQTEDLPF